MIAIFLNCRALLSLVLNIMQLWHSSDTRTIFPAKTGIMANLINKLRSKRRRDYNNWLNIYHKYMPGNSSSNKQQQRMEHHLNSRSSHTRSHREAIKSLKPSFYLGIEYNKYQTWIYLFPASLQSTFLFGPNLSFQRLLLLDISLENHAPTVGIPR